MSTFNRFTPGAANATLGVTTTTGNVSLSGAGAVLRIANVSTVEAFVATGSSTIAATTGGFSIPGATVTYITLDPNATHLAGITSASTTTLRLNRGDGA